MKNRQILVAVLTAVCLMTVFRPLSAQTTEPLAFTDFLSKVRAHYPLLKKQHRRVEEAIAAQHEAIAGFLPRFTGVSAWTTGDDPVYVFGTLLKQGAFTSGDFDVARLNSPETRSNFSYGVEGRWMLFDAFDTISRVRGAGQRVRSETLNSEFADMETTLLAIEAFCRAALEENLGRFAREVQTASQKDLGEAESLSQKGLVLGADFYTAKVNGGLIERLYNRFERDFKSSRVVLNILMGQDPLIELALDYDIVPVAGQAQGLREWLQSAYLYRKDFEAADAAIQAAESEDFRQRMSFLPKISAFGAVEDNTHGWHDQSGNYLLGIRGQVDLFDGTYGSRTEQAALKLKAAIEDKNDLKDRITQALAEESGRYETITADLPVAERMLSDAKNAMEMTQMLYSQGKKSVADLLEIRRVYLETAVKSYQTRFYAQTSYSRLLFLSGRLDQAAAERIAAGLKKR